MKVSKKDKIILRELANKIAEISILPVQQKRKEMWTQLNNLEKVKPMVWINEIPWHEMDVDHELKLQTSDPFCRNIEDSFRKTIYQWKHMQGDMVIEPVIYCPLAISNSGFGISENSDILKMDADTTAPSRHFHPQMIKEEDVEKIKMPVVTHNKEKTEENCQAMLNIFDGILPVEKRGAPGFWFSPWDELITWTGVQEGLMDLIMRPAYIHKIMERLVQAYLRQLDQYEKQNLLSLNNNNARIGSGAYGYTDELPGHDYNPAHVRTSDLWGCGTAQIFSDVSPDMHWEFALQYEIRWMKRFALNYYGCCEPLHNKMEVLKKVPNLRKISMSPWADITKAREKGGDNYVFSIKPNPAILAEDIWRPDAARAELEQRLNQAKGCNVEIIMKDISTVYYKPQRLWEWAEIASEVSN